MKEKEYTPKDISILYQDEKYIIVHKPANLVVHPYKGIGAPKSSQSLMGLVRDKLNQYVYPIHRLDGPVSGPVIFALKGKFVKDVQDVWHDETTQKKYFALCKGILPVKGQYDFALKERGPHKKTALTLFDPIRPYGDFTLVDIEIKTGRKHQIRRHFSRRCHNLVGDVKYGNGKVNNLFRDNFNLNRIFLHCHTLKLTLPTCGEIEINCPLPSELQDILDSLDKKPLYIV